MRFKELRGLFLGLLMAFLDAGLFIYAVTVQDKIKIIAAVFMMMFVLINLLSQFYIRILQDCIFLYHFAGIALLPKIVDFKDIQVIKKMGKHHLMIETAKDSSHIYVWNAEKLLEILNKNKESMKNEKN